MTPSQSAPEQWYKQYSDYHHRQIGKRLRAAFCKFESVGGREALATRFEDAPLMSKADWENLTPQVMGRHIHDVTAKRLAAKIAERGCIIDQ